MNKLVDKYENQIFLPLLFLATHMLEFLFLGRGLGWSPSYSHTKTKVSLLMGLKGYIFLALRKCFIQIVFRFLWPCFLHGCAIGVFGISLLFFHLSMHSYRLCFGFVYLSSYGTASSKCPWYSKKISLSNLKCFESAFDASFCLG